MRQQCCPLYRDKESTKTRNYSIFWGGGFECTTYWFMLLFIQTPKKLLKGDQNQQKLCLACLFYALAPQQATISSRSIIDVLSTAVAVSLPKRTNVNGKKNTFPESKTCAGSYQDINVRHNDPNNNEPRFWKVPLGVVCSSNAPECRKPACASTSAPVQLFGKV